MILVNFQSEVMEIAATYNETVNDDSLGLTHILVKGEVWMEMEQKYMINLIIGGLTENGQDTRNPQKSHK